MSWFRIEDGFHQHPKVGAAGNAAVGLWVRCGSYSSQYLTDGQIPSHVVGMYGKVPEVRALMDTEMWVESGEGFLIPDYLDYNPTAAQVKSQRIARVEAGRRGGAASGRSRRDPS